MRRRQIPTRVSTGSRTERIAKLCYIGHVLIENRSGLAVDTLVTEAEGRAVRSAAIAMLSQTMGHHAITAGAGKAYDTREDVEKMRRLGVVPHVAQNDTNRSSAIDGRTTRHPGYAVSQRKRKCVEQIFGWLKTIAMIRKTRHRGTDRVDWMFVFALAVYNLVRIRNAVRVAA